MAVKLSPSAESTLTDRYQTTVPEPVRKALGLNKRDKICYTIQANGRVIISRMEQSDPLLGKFLSFLAKDIESNPDRIQKTSQKINSDLVSRAQDLVSGIEVDLEAPLLDEDE
jgi:antitoxin PrlF